MNSRIVSDDEFNLIERTLDIPKYVACQQVGHDWRIKIIPTLFHFKTVKDFLLQGNMVEVLTTLIHKKYITFKFLLDTDVDNTRVPMFASYQVQISSNRVNRLNDNVNKKVADSARTRKLQYI